MENTVLTKLHDIAKLLPSLPGVYHFYDEVDTVIYIGKAKKLQKRVLSYFTKKHDSGKTRVLVKKIRKISHIVVETETDALLLENNLIKKHQPKYNILLKDDKTYPWICVKNEDFPRVFMTRNYINDGSKYYGPYTSIYLVKTILKLFKDLFKLRTCKHNLSTKNILANKFKVCLEYHINNCKAPCVGLQTAYEYDKYIDQIHNILKGNFTNVIQYLKTIMTSYATKYEFEKAQDIKEKLDILKTYQKKSTVVSNNVGNVDVFSIDSDEDFVFVNYLRVVNGAIIQVQTLEFKQKIDESLEDILPSAITEILYTKTTGFSNAKEIIVPFNIYYNINNTKITVPQKGEKHKLLELSQRNLKYFILEKKKKKTLVDPDRHKNRILLKIKQDLRLSELPVHIECFDNSNIQGTNPVAACVVFRNAKPFKKDYRKFKIKTVVGPDDFASMEEVMSRRYKRLIKEKQSLPQLIIIDGGKGQLSSAYRSLKELNLHKTIAIIGIAKRLEEIFFPGDNIPIYLDKNSETLKVIQHARNEAHRFGITFHRDLRSKNFIKSQLENIPGVGEKTIIKLLTEFKTIDAIFSKNIDEIAKITGISKAKIILEYLGQNL